MTGTSNVSDDTTNRTCGRQFCRVVAATIDVAYFQDFYATFDLGHDGSAALFRDDGTLLVRRPPWDAATGTDA